MNTEQASILFVCYANICRSPTAEAVFRHKALNEGLRVKVDSAGTHAHKGKTPDKRSQKVAIPRGYHFHSIKSRPIADEDFENFDYILAMDASNVANLKEKCDEEHHHKIRLFLDFAADSVNAKVQEVPDPFYGGRRGFEIVLDLIELASEGLIEHLQEKPNGEEAG